MTHRTFGDQPTDRPGVPRVEPLDIEQRQYATGSGQDQGSQGQGDQGMSDSAKQGAQQAKQKAGEMGGQAQEKADQGMEKAAEGLHRAAETLREQGEGREGKVGSVATSAAGALEQGAERLRGSDTDQLLNEVEAMVRRKPVESVLVAAGIGFVLSKALR